MKRVVEISKAGRAPKNDPAILTVALMVADKASRVYGLQALHDVCRTGTHLLHFMALYEQVAPSGHRYGRAVRDALASWYTSKKPEQVAYQVVKYAQRDGWAQRDVLRLAHPKPVNTAMSEAFRYAVKGEWGGESPEIIKATETLKVLDEVESACAVIREYKLPREAVEHAGSQWLQRPEIWRALLPQMPMEAMIRNLGVMTARGVLNGMTDETQEVVRRLGDEDKLHEARAHKHKLPVDGFVILTDSETWAGMVHPAAALRKYREETGIDARLIVVGMVSNGFTIADPSDPGMLDVVGFDTATPALIGDFVARRF